MLSLPELQRDFVASLVGTPSAALRDAVEPDGLDAQRRLQIYANHYRLSLVEALGATFPVVRRLLGDDCFGQVMRRFVRAYPPRDPRLIAYGGSFPGFLTTQPHLAGLPWLRDVARLEWALNESRHAPDSASSGVEPGHDAVGDPERLSFAVAPSVRFIASRWPVDQIWRVNMAAGDAAAIRLEDRGARLLIVRDPDDEVGWLPLPHAAFSFTRALSAGHSLGRAIELALALDPTFAPLPLLRALLDEGVLVDATPPSNAERMPS